MFECVKPVDFSLYGYIFSFVLMRYRKIFRLEERTSFGSVLLETFSKNGYFEDEILHHSRRISPILNWQTAFDSACAIAYHRTQLNQGLSLSSIRESVPIENSVHRCSNTEMVVVIELTERNIGTTLDIDILSDSSHSDIERYPC